MAAGVVSGTFFVSKSGRRLRKKKLNLVSATWYWAGDIGKVRSFDTQEDCALARLLIRCVIPFAGRRTFLNRRRINFYGRYLVSNNAIHMFVWELLLIGSIPRPAALPMTSGIIHLPSACWRVFLKLKWSARWRAKKLLQRYKNIKYERISYQPERSKTIFLSNLKDL